MTVSQSGDAGERTEMSPLTSGATLTYAMDAATGFTLQSSSTGVVSAAANSGAARSTTARVTVVLNGRSTTSSPATITQSGAEITYSLVLDPASASIGFNESKTYRAYLVTSSGGIEQSRTLLDNSSLAWNVNSAIATITSAGIFSSQSTVGNVTVTATYAHSSGTLNANATVSIVGSDGEWNYEWDDGGTHSL